jgi:hypothetical protein
MEELNIELVSISKELVDKYEKSSENLLLKIYPKKTMM